MQNRTIRGCLIACCLAFLPMSYALSKPSPLEGVRAEGAPVVAIDPDVDNVRARRAYEKAGFRGDAIVETGEGFAVLMTLETRASRH